jgi:hypothetical protein
VLKESQAGQLGLSQPAKGRWYAVSKGAAAIVVESRWLSSACPAQNLFRKRQISLLL